MNHGKSFLNNKPNFLLCNICSISYADKLKKQIDSFLYFKIYFQSLQNYQTRIPFLKAQIQNSQLEVQKLKIHCHNELIQQEHRNSQNEKQGIDPNQEMLYQIDEIPPKFQSDYQIMREVTFAKIQFQSLQQDEERNQTKMRNSENSENFNHMTNFNNSQQFFSFSGIFFPIRTSNHYGVICGCRLGFYLNVIKLFPFFSF